MLLTFVDPSPDDYISGPTSLMQTGGVDQKGLWTVVHKDVWNLIKTAYHFYAINCSMAKDKISYFQEPILYHPNCIKSRTLWQPYDKFRRNLFPRISWNWQLSKNPKSWMLKAPGPLTAMTISYILFHLALHILPVIMSVQQVIRLHPSRMIRECCITMFLY